jgi:hypothetical protein
MKTPYNRTIIPVIAAMTILDATANNPAPDPVLGKEPEEEPLDDVAAPAVAADDDAAAGAFVCVVAALVLVVETCEHVLDGVSQ